MPLLDSNEAERRNGPNSPAEIIICVRDQGLGARPASRELMNNYIFAGKQVTCEDLLNLQLAGPASLLLAVAAADSASWALSQSPSSALLWYLNLEVFSLFRRSRWVLSDVGSLPFAQLLLIAGPLGLLALIGIILRRNLLVAHSEQFELCVRNVPDL